MSESQNLAGYQDAWQAAAYFQPPWVGSLTVAGKDREGFIQRQTTNDIRHLKSDRALLTVLTSPTARILDVLYLLSEQDQIRALALASGGEATAGFLKSRIFFMDQVTVLDTGAELVWINLVGPEIARVFKQACELPYPELERLVTLQVGDYPVRFFAARTAVLPGGIFVLPPAAVGALMNQLESAGASRMSPEAWEIFRIESGLPGPQSEMNEDYTPLEIGLSEAISDSKGCYTGQEIIARQITYDKITQQLRVLRMEKLLEPGAQIRVDGKRVGVLTSAVESPRFGAIGLAVVKRPYLESGTLVELETGDGSQVPARIDEAPLIN